ncbi:hypothetical protein QP580_12650, partial [Prevotella bivia]|nr:hypothetical protein [Prevotella bivia]
DPHVIHVSTAYVSGLAKGLRREGRLTHTADWRAEYDMALAAKDRVEAQSRTPEVLRRLMRRAAFEAMQAVALDDAYANLVLPSILRRHRVDARDAA